MTKRIILPAILVILTLLFQYGCKTTEVAKESEAADQPQVTPEVQTMTQTAQEAQSQAQEPVEQAAPTESKFVLRVNCGYFGDAYTDKAGNVWQPDQEKTDDNKWGADYGQTIERPGLNIPDTDCPLIYESERYSMDDYKFDVPNGKYTVKLHFAETFEGIYDVGERVFSVSINGKEVLKDLDPYKEAGEFNKPVVKTFKGVEPVDGQIVVGFAYNIENPQINGIEVISE